MKHFTALFVLLIFMASNVQAFEMFKKSGVQPPYETIFKAELYCAMMVRVSEMNGDLEEAANWCDNLVCLRKMRIAYAPEEPGIWYANVYIYAEKYQTLDRQIREVTAKLK